MDLSIAIVSWNTRDLLDQCLRSVYKTTNDIEFEVIVVDNASNDNTAKMVRRGYPQVIFVENSQNNGFAQANNQAYDASRGRYFMLLNPDTIVLTGLSPIMRFLDSNSDVGVASCKCLNSDGSIQKNWYDYYPSLQWELLPSGLRHALERIVFRRDPHTRFETKWIGGQCMTVRRICVGQVGLMDPGYFIYTEETDWCYRLRQAGWKVCHFPGIEVIHLGGQSTSQARSEMIIELYRSKHRFIREHFSSAHSILFKRGLQLRTFVLSALLLFQKPTTEGSQRKAAVAGLLNAIRDFN